MCLFSVLYVCFSHYVLSGDDLQCACLVDLLQPLFSVIAIHNRYCTLYEKVSHMFSLLKTSAMVTGGKSFVVDEASYITGGLSFNGLRLFFEVAVLLVLWVHCRSVASQIETYVKKSQCSVLRSGLAKTVASGATPFFCANS